MAPSKGQEAQRRVKAGAFLLDVRTPDEYRMAHLDGAVNIPVQVLASRMSEVPKGRSLVVYCAAGVRSAAAVELLRQAGFADVFDLGGMGEWHA